MSEPFLALVRNRHSIRRYSERPVAPEQLDAILEAANRAPSAGNLQAYAIYRVRDPGCRAALARAALGQSAIVEAPVVLVFCQDRDRSRREYGRRGADLYALQDATIACAFAMLAAVAQGLGTVWIGAFDPAPVRHALGAPHGHDPVAILPIGHPGEQPQATSRRSLEDLVNER